MKRTGCLIDYRNFLTRLCLTSLVLICYTTSYALNVGEFRVRTKTDMNVRKAPVVTPDNIVGTAKANNVFTIVATYGTNWGLMKSGGYMNISSKYCDRV